MERLGSGKAVTLYVGALLGPSVLLLPGLAAGLAGPASVVAWLGLLVVSGLLAVVFSALGSRLPSRAGAAGYAGAAFGPVAQRVVAACFLAGVVLGAPVVCLIGAGYVAQALGGGAAATHGIAAALLLAVVCLTVGGTRVSGAAQLALVAVLTALVVLAVAGSLPHARAAHWEPFAPHGWTAVGSAASVLVLSFVGWEAIAPMAARLRSPRRQLPRVIALAFGVTSVVYLGLAVATVSVLGAGAGSATPVADLLRVAVGPAGVLAAAVAAVALSLAATNAYLSGAAETIDALRAPRPLCPSPVARTAPVGRARAASLQLAVGAAGLALLGAAATGVLTVAQLVHLPTAMFLAVYLVSTAAGARLLTGWARWCSAAACVAIVVVTAHTGVGVVAAGAVALAAAVPWWRLARRRAPRPVSRPGGRGIAFRRAPTPKAG